jgi:hypothetical protein
MNQIFLIQQLMSHQKKGIAYWACSITTARTLLKVTKTDASQEQLVVHLEEAEDRLDQNDLKTPKQVHQHTSTDLVEAAGETQQWTSWTKIRNIGIANVTLMDSMEVQSCQRRKMARNFKRDRVLHLCIEEVRYHRPLRQALPEIRFSIGILQCAHLQVLNQYQVA